MICIIRDGIGRGQVYSGRNKAGTNEVPIFLMGQVQGVYLSE